MTEHVAEHVTEHVGRLLETLRTETLATAELMERLDLSHRPTFLYGYLRPALTFGWIAMTSPDKPRSSKQRYRITPRGIAALERPRQRRK